MTADELETLIRVGKGHELAEAIASFDEPQRKALSKKAAELHRWARANQPSLVSQRAAGVALLGLCGWTEAKKWRPISWGYKPEPEVERVLRDRRPEWLDKWVQQELDAELFNDWISIRRFIRDGICQRPTTDLYILGMLRSIYWWDGPVEQVLTEKIRRDPGLLEYEVWRIFDADFADRNVFHTGEFDNGQNKGWGPSLVELANSGELDRARLLTASLDALNRRQQPTNASWFFKLHEALAPTLAERIERQAKYADLLVNSIPAVVGFAIDALKPIAGSGQLDAGKVVDGLSAALLLRQKGHAMNAVRLLKACAKNQAGGAGIGRVAAMGLDHPAVEVQTACVEILEQAGIAGAEELIAARVEAIAPSLRERAQKLLGEPPAAPAVEQNQSDAESIIAEVESIDSRWRAAAGIDAALTALRDGGDLSPVVCNPLAVPRLDPADPISPITSMDDLIERLSQGVEKLESAIELELLMDAMLRLVDRPADFTQRVAPLLQRAVEMTGTNANAVMLGTDPQLKLRSLVKAWILREELPWDVHGREALASTMQRWGQADRVRRGIGDFLAARMSEVATMVRQGIAGPLLALPTHTGGWIDPRELVRRIGTFNRDMGLRPVPATLENQARPIPDPTGTGQRPVSQQRVDLPRFDLLQALLRLAPDHRGDALQAAVAIPGETGAALRYALGGDETIGTDAALWIAAGRARSPFGEIPLAQSVELHRDMGLRPMPATSENQPHPNPNTTGTGWKPVSRASAETEPFEGGFGPDAAIPAKLDWRFIEKSDRWETSSTLRISCQPPLPKEMVAVDLPTVLGHELQTTFWAIASIAQIRCQAAVWPANPEAFFAQGAMNLASRLNNPASTWSPTAQYFEPLFDQDTPLGPMARLALCLGMLSKDAAARGMAIDAMIAVITDGRCTGEEIGNTLAALREASSIVRLNRIAESLSEISRVGPLHQYVCAKTVEAFLAALHVQKAEPSADLHHLLTPLREWLTALGCGASQQVCNYLQQLNAGGKTRGLIKAIVSMPVRQGAPKPVILRAIQGRAERAGRWDSRLPNPPLVPSPGTPVEG